MSPVFPFDIFELVIEAVGENEDTNLLKELALVSHSFHQICSKHLFATVELHDADPKRHIASSKQGFVKLIESRPDVFKYIRKLTYETKCYFYSPISPSSSIYSDDELLSPILPNFLRTISGLNCLKIDASELDWQELDSSLTSALLHLMHLPTVNHIDLSSITNFPLSAFNPSVNLYRLDIFRVYPIIEDGELEDSSLLFVQSGMMPKLREFHISGSHWMTTNLLLAKGQDGQPAFNFMDLIGLSIPFTRFERGEWNIRYALQNAKLIEKLHISLFRDGTLVDLHDVLFLRARTLKVLDLTVFLTDTWNSFFLGGLCEELEALAGHNMLEALFLKILVDGYETEYFIGSIIQKVEGVLVKPGWSALRKVSFKLEVEPDDRAKLSVVLRSFPDKYLSHLSKLVSVTFNCSVSS